MAGMVGWGTMAAVIAGGARIAAERSIGWNRQLRITPLPVRTYFLHQGGVAATRWRCVSIVVLYVAGAALGVRLAPATGCEMTALILVGLIPFAVLGILLGHLLTVDSMGPALGGITSLFALLGGAWGPTADERLLLPGRRVPAVVLAGAGRQDGLGGDAWPLQAWIVLVVWTAVLAALAVWAYRRDTGRA